MLSDKLAQDMGNIVGLIISGKISGKQIREELTDEDACVLASYGLIYSTLKTEMPCDHFIYGFYLHAKLMQLKEIETLEQINART